MKPDWDRLAKQFKKNYPDDVIIADVDCTVHEALCKEHDVSGYPTIKTFKKGDPKGLNYDGPRSFGDLKRHAASLVPLKKQLYQQFQNTPWWRQALVYVGTLLVIFIVGQVMRLW